MMYVSFAKEEAALRRRALFRLLRRFDFDAPEFRGEAISEPVHERVSAPEYQQSFNSSVAGAMRSGESAKARATAIAGPPPDWATGGRGDAPRP